MSGISGIVYLDPGRMVKPDTVYQMMQVMAHRGKDGTHLWHEGSVGLGHQMLHTTPESLTEVMPLQNTSARHVLTADARIDNRSELAAALRMDSHEACTLSDGGFILAAYERWGEACTERLVGDFAFAIWDKASQTLFCARDHFGVRPFYYYYAPNRLFAFASEIKALLALPEIPGLVNETMVGNYLIGLVDDKAITFYQDILRLPPAHLAALSRNKMVLRSYWHLDPSRELRLRSDADYTEQFRARFFEAVSSRLRSAFPVGAHLSGGLDSSSIACVARNLIPKEKVAAFPTYSAVFDLIPECDERSFIEPVLSLGGFDSHYVYPDKLGPLTNIDDMIYQQDGPFFTVHVPTLHSEGVYRSARESGTRVLLSGTGGDSTVSYGYIYLTELLRGFKVPSFLREAIGLSRHSHIRVQDVIRQFAISPWVPRRLRSIWRRLHGRGVNVQRLSPLIRSDFAERTRLLERIQKIQTDDWDPLQSSREFHREELSAGIISYALEILNKAQAARGLETRYPFYDKRLVEFCVSLPSEQKMFQGWSRVILRRAMEGILPKAVQWRKSKADLNPLFIKNLYRFEREKLKSLIDCEMGPLASVIDVEEARRIFERYNLKPTRVDSVDLYRIFLLNKWMAQKKGGIK